MLLSVRGLGKRFGGERVLADVSFDLEAHRTLAVRGRSGCGKTTLLRIIAGLAAPDSGSIVLGGRTVTGLPPAERGVLYLYQEPLLFPHLDVFENIAFGLRLRDRPDGEIRAAVERMIEELELAPHARKMPSQLSGGQRQRVSFGRALAVNPALLLLDEPFSSLDPETRAAMQQLFKRVAREHAITSLFVTHDLKEAILMGDSLALLQDGSVTHFATRRAFIGAAESGVAGEIAWWKSLEEEAP